LHYLPQCLRAFFLFFYLCLSFVANAQNADIDLLKHINLNRNTRLDPAFRFVTNSVTPLSLALPVGMIGTGMLSHDKALRNKGYEMGAAVASAFVVSRILKYTINRPRPYVTYPVLDNVVSETDPSFPSGHTTAAFATATTLAIHFPKWYVIVPAYVWAAGAGYSRMHLGVHYPSDVLAGAVTGAGSAYLTHKANQWLQRRKKQKQ
jgi:membrane-associated phospholipid phosphatase